MSKGTAARVGAFCVVVWLSMVALVPAATACTCIQSESPCADLRQADAVFEAVVDRVVEGPGFVEQIPGPEGRTLKIPEYVVSFRGGQSLVGARVDRVVTPTQEESCGFTFEPGARYLVVAFRRPADGAFIVSRCSPTRRIPLDAPIRRPAPPLKAGVPAGQVLGAVLLGQVQPVSGARVTIKGRLTRSTVTGSDGRYLLTGLPPGRYTVSVRPPRALAAATAASVSISIDPETRCAEINPVLAPGTRITGTVTNPEPNSPFPARVELWRQDSPGAVPRLARIHPIDEMGQYRFDDPLPGRYFVGVRVGATPMPEQPFVETRAESAAGKTVFDIALREHVVLRPMTLQHAPVIQLSGQILGREGTPRGGVAVWLSGPGPNPHVAAAVSAADGSFTARVMGGERYRLTAKVAGIAVAATDLEVNSPFVTLTLPD